MKILLLCFFTSLYYISQSSAEPVLLKDITTVDIVLSGLKDQSWGEDERPCFDQTLTILKNVRNYTVWAVWIWNSMHHPVGTFFGSEYSLGNYDQCMSAPSKSADPQMVTKYCLANVKLTTNKEGNHPSVLGPTGPYVATKTAIGRNLNKVTWGTCLPSTCKPGSISKILKTIYLANPLTPSEPEITVESCQIAGEKMDFSYGFYAFMSLMMMLLTASVLSTCYLQHCCTKSGVIHAIADSFSMDRNWKSLIKKSDDDIGFLNLVKVSCATLAVTTHTAFFEVMGPISNGLQYDELLLQTEMAIVNCLKHTDLAVDIFFLVSGLLLVKGLMEKKKKPMIALVKRYFRITASFVVVMFYVASVSIYTGYGPIWQKFAGREQKACVDNWWLGVLMLNNYVNAEDICLIVSWYIPCDYQLAVMGTILYVIWQKDRTIAKVVVTITVMLAVLMPGVITYWRRLPGLIVFHDVEKIFDFRKNEVYLDTYIRSHNRAGPYIVGMIMGYVFSKYKPKSYRNIISKKRLVILLAVSCIIAYQVATAPVSWVTLEYDPWSSALYAVSSRNLWALSACITIVVVEYGEIGSLRKFTDWHGFTILSRLAYGIYLTHSVILQQNMYSRKNLQQFDILYSEILHGFGVLTISIIFATFLWMFVEAPLNNIVNLVIDSGSKGQSRNQRTKEEEPSFNKADPKIKRS